MMTWEKALIDCEARILEAEKELRSAKSKLLKLQAARRNIKQFIIDKMPWPGLDI